MVEFCPDCSNLLRRQFFNGSRILVCRCGFQKDLAPNVEDVKKNARLKEEALNNNLIVVSHEDKISVHPHVKKFCPKCSSCCFKKYGFIDRQIFTLQGWSHRRCQKYQCQVCNHIFYNMELIGMYTIKMIEYVAYMY